MSRLPVNTMVMTTCTIVAIVISLHRLQTGTTSVGLISSGMGSRINIRDGIKNISSSDVERIIKQVLKDGVVVIPSVKLSPSELVSFTGKLGDLIQLPEGLYSTQHNKYPVITFVGNLDSEGGQVIPGVNKSEYWHHDGDANPDDEINVWNVLHAIEVPQKGGQTGFMDMKRALDKIPESLLKKLRSCQYTVVPKLIEDFNDEIASRMPTVAHDAIRKHSVTGDESLYIGMHLICDGVSISLEEEDKINKKIFDLINVDGVRYYHDWSVGDILVWDNTRVIHRGMGGYENQRRWMYRVQAQMAHKFKYFQMKC